MPQVAGLSALGWSDDLGFSLLPSGPIMLQDLPTRGQPRIKVWMRRLLRDYRSGAAGRGTQNAAVSVRPTSFTGKIGVFLCCSGL